MTNSSDKITISDVAKAAGVSIATVSRILNNQDGKIKISDKTKHRVLQVVEELGYQLNPFASALRSKRSSIIGAVVKDVGDPFLVKLLKQIQKEVYLSGYELLIGHAEQDEIANRHLSVMSNNWFDGLIIFTEFSDEFPQLLEQRSIPYVIVGGGLDFPMIKPSNTSGRSGNNTISEHLTAITDDKVGIYMAVKHLKELGHHHIGYVGNDDRGVNIRLQHFKQAILESDFHIDEQFITNNANSRSVLTKYFENFKDKIHPTAIVCANDILARKAIHCAERIGLRVPQDLSVIGFDDIDDAVEYEPEITTIQQPYHELAKFTVKSLIACIQDPKAKHGLASETFTPTLIERQSTSPPNSP